MTSPVLEEIQAFLQKQLHKSHPEAVLERDTPLLDSGYFDSLALYSLVIFIEERYGIEIGEDEIVFKNFENLLTIEALIKRIQAADHHDL